MSKKNITTNKILFVVTNYNNYSLLIKCDKSLEWLIDEGGHSMNEILGTYGSKTLPIEEGIYSCDMMIHSYQDNTPDSIDWNLDIWLENVKKINSLEL